MAYDNIEVEIKIPLTPEGFSQLQANLRQMADYVGRSQQADEYFSPPNRDFVEPRYPFEWLSIRRRGGKTILNYKHYYPENVAVTSHCDEFETEVGDPHQLKKLFDNLGFRSLITVRKERITYQYKNEFEVALDSVDDLGHFAEIEAIKSFGGVEVTRKALEEFARKLGLDATNQDLRGYPYLLMKKFGLIKNHG